MMSKTILPISMDRPEIKPINPEMEELHKKMKELYKSEKVIKQVQASLKRQLRIMRWKQKIYQNIGRR